jgi:acyl-CoA thioester hydrolase
MKHRCRHTVRSYELDSYGHVNNANYLNYLEYGRICFLNSCGFSYQDFRETGYALVVTRVEIDYRAPASHGDVLDITTSPKAKRLVGGTFSQVIQRKHVIVAEALVSWVCLNPSGRPSRLPEGFDVPALVPEKNA